MSQVRLVTVGYLVVNVQSTGIKCGLGKGVTVCYLVVNVQSTGAKYGLGKGVTVGYLLNS